jgi:hypothetical protein|tara:strand:+ start:12351 stop:12557 length:207 start_codon:yes stop_codon:yes gene_type:complete
MTLKPLYPNRLTEEQTAKVDRINSNLKMMLCHHEYSFDASWRHRLSNHIQRLIHREEFDDALRYLRDM